MRVFHLLGLAVLGHAATAAPLAGQEKEGDPNWYLEGIRKGFCIQLLLDPSSPAVQGLPSGFRALAASEAKDLHVSLRDVVSSQSEFATWAPSRLCFEAVDSIRSAEFTVRGKRDRPQLFGFWTVRATAPGGQPRDLVLDLYTTSGRLARVAGQMGQAVRESRLRVGKVPAEDENGVPSSDDRFEVKIGKTLITWDGRLANDTVRVAQPLEMEWAFGRGAESTVRVTLSPVYSRSMAGALKVDGKDDFAKALRASPTRFAGPAYEGGGGVVRLKP